MITAVQFYDVVLFVHILAVVLAFGPTFAYPVFLAVAEKTDPRGIPAVGRGIDAWDKIANLLMVVVFGAGIYLVVDGDWRLGEFYISWGVAVMIFFFAITGMYFTPKTRELVEIAERDIGAAGDGEVKFSAEFNALNEQIGKVGAFAGILIILTVYIMTAKPFL